MKSQHYIIIILLVLTSTLTVNAQTASEQILGTWTFDYETSLDMMNQKSKDRYDSMDIIKKNRLSSVYKDRKISFNNDGSYTQVLANKKTINASWSLDSNDNIEIIASNGSVIKFSIIATETNKLTLKQVSTVSTNLNVLIKDWYLTKK